MTNFKKIAASVMAAVSLATTAMATAGISANAYSGPTAYVSFGNNSTAGIYRDSNLISISTSSSTSSTVYVELTGTSGASASGTKNKYGYNGSVSLSFKGSGFTAAYSYHSAGGYSINLTR